MSFMLGSGSAGHVTIALTLEYYGNKGWNHELNLKYLVISSKKVKIV